MDQMNKDIRLDIYEGNEWVGYCGDTKETNKKLPKGGQIKKYISLMLVSSLISSSVVGGALYYKFSNDLKNQVAMNAKYTNLSESNSQRNGNATNSTMPVAYVNRGLPVPQISKKVGPSIVGIKMTVTGQQNPWFQSSGDSVAEGSGVIISKDGYIMTNYHVVGNADPKVASSKNTVLDVFLPDKRQTKGTFVGGDKRNDLAVIKIDLDNLSVAELGDSSKLEVGESAIAIGNPLGMEFAGSVTSGVISALNRKVEVEDKTLNLIQTDAAINPGNSGGALVNSNGQVVGINTIKISVSGVEGLGFAIPINDAKPIIDQLTLFGYVKGRPLIGITGQEINEAISQQYSLPMGIYIVQVAPESGAEKAGLKKGDILVKMAGQDIKTMKNLDEIKNKYKAGDKVDITIVRESNKQDLKLTFTEDK